MRKFILAALLALPFFAIGVQKASAGGCCDGCCTPTCRIGMSIGLNWRGWCLKDRGPVDPCPNCGPSGGGCGNPCGYGPVPPWYTFWPGGGSGGTPFPTPAPTGYPYWPAPQGPVSGPLFGANFNNQQAPAMPMAQPTMVQPCGYYPQQPPAYWYGQ